MSTDINKYKVLKKSEKDEDILFIDHLIFLYTSVHSGCTEKEEVEMLNTGVSLEYIKKLQRI